MHFRAVSWSTPWLFVTVVHCSAAMPMPARTPSSGTAPVAIAEPPAGPAPDLSEAPPPANLLFVVRAPSSVRIGEHMQRLTGAPFSLSFDTLYAAFDLQREGVLDPNAAIDVLYLATTDGTAHEVISVGAMSQADVQRILGDAHHLGVLPNGVRRLESPHVATGTQPYECVIAPTPRSDRTRIVCSQVAGFAEAAAPFAARTLTRGELASDLIVAEASADSLRTVFSRNWNQWFDTAETDVAGALATAATGTRGTIAPFSSAIRTFFAGGRPLLDDTRGLIAGCTFRQDRVSMQASVDVQSRADGWMHALSGATRGQPAVPPEFVNRLMPDGLLYLAGSMDATALRALLAQFSALAELVSAQATAFDAADRSALQTAVAGIGVFEQTSMALAFGHDDLGTPWVTATLRTGSVGAARVVSAYRAFAAAIRRPHIARVMASVLGDEAPMDVRRFREMPAARLPRGAFGVRWAVPPMTVRGNSAARPLHGADYGIELLLVPNGQDLTIVMSDGALDLYTRFRANHTPGIDPALLAQNGGALSVAVVPAGLPNLMRANDSQNANSLGMVVQHMPDRGRTPVTLRLATTEENGLVHVSIDGDLPASLLRTYLEMAMAGQQAARRPAL